MIEGSRVPHRARTGATARPVFGELPAPAAQKRPERKVHRDYAGHIETIREHPGQWAKVYEAKLGSDAGPAMTKERSRKMAVWQKTALLLYLRQVHPLERWRVSIRTVKDTWGDREIWMRYDGTWTEEERAADEASRKRQQKWRMDIARRKKAEKEAAAKAQILQMQSQRQGGRRG